MIAVRFEDLMPSPSAYMAAQPLRLACYADADGCRVVISGPLNADFEGLRSLFIQLGAAPGESISLDTAPFIASAGEPQVRLISDHSIPRRAAHHGIRRVRGAACPSFNWRLAPEEWDDCAELLTGLIAMDAPCHQYLNDHPAEDATVVVSKGEPGEWPG